MPVSFRFALGVTLAVLGNIGINTGQNLQSKGLRRLKEKRHGELTMNSSLNGDAGEASPVMTLRNRESVVADVKVKSTDSCTWCFGFACYLTGSITVFLCLSLAPTTVIVAIESLQFVSNLFWTRVLLKIKIKPRMIIGTLFIVMGISFIVVYGPKEDNRRRTVKEYMHLWTNWVWLGYLIFVAVTTPMVEVVYRVYSRARLAGKPLWRSKIVRPLCFAFVSAQLGAGTSVVFAKSFLDLIGIGIDYGDHVFESWFLYVNLAAFGLCGFFWLYRLNSMLGKFGPQYGIPIIQTCYILSATLSGGIFYQAYHVMTRAQLWKWTMGAFCVFFGLYLLAFDGLMSEEKERESQLKAKLLANDSNVSAQAERV